MSHRPTSRHDNRLVSPEDRKNINGMHGVGQSPPARTKTIIHAPRHGQTPEDYAAATGTADRRSRPDKHAPSYSSRSAPKGRSSMVSSPTVFKDNLNDQMPHLRPSLETSRSQATSAYDGKMGDMPSGLKASSSTAVSSSRAVNGATQPSRPSSSKNPFATDSRRMPSQYRNANLNSPRIASAPARASAREVIEIDGSDEESDAGPSRLKPLPRSRSGSGSGSGASTVGKEPRLTRGSTTFARDRDTSSSETASPNPALMAKEKRRAMDSEKERMQDSSAGPSHSRRPDGPIPLEEPNDASEYRLAGQKQKRHEHVESVPPRQRQRQTVGSSVPIPDQGLVERMKARPNNSKSARKEPEHQPKSEHDARGDSVASPAQHRGRDDANAIPLQGLVISDIWRSLDNLDIWMTFNDSSLTVFHEGDSRQSKFEIAYKDIRMVETSARDFGEHAQLNVVLDVNSRTARRIQSLFPEFDPKAIEDAAFIQIRPDFQRCQDSSKAMHVKDVTPGPWRKLLKSVSDAVPSWRSLDANAARTKWLAVQNVMQKLWPSGTGEANGSSSASTTTTSASSKRAPRKLILPGDDRKQRSNAGNGAGTGAADDDDYTDSLTRKRTFEIAQPVDDPSDSVRRSTRQRQLKLPFDSQDSSSTGPTEASKKRKAELDESEQILSYPFDGKGAIQIFARDLRRLDDGEFLNDTVLEFGLKLMHEEIRQRDPQLADQIYIFSSFFYMRLCELAIGRSYPNVRKWTSKVDLFEKKYLVVPINEDLHWYCAIVVNPFYMTQSYPSQRKEPKRRSSRFVVPGSDDVEMPDAETQNSDKSKEQSQGFGRAMSESSIKTPPLPKREASIVRDRVEAPSSRDEEMPTRPSSPKTRAEEAVVEESEDEISPRLLSGVTINNSSSSSSSSSRSSDSEDMAKLDTTRQANAGDVQSNASRRSNSPPTAATKARPADSQASSPARRTIEVVDRRASPRSHASPKPISIVSTQTDASGISSGFSMLMDEAERVRTPESRRPNTGRSWMELEASSDDMRSDPEQPIPVPLLRGKAASPLNKSSRSPLRQSNREPRQSSSPDVEEVAPEQIDPLRGKRVGGGPGPSSQETSGGQARTKIVPGAGRTRSPSPPPPAESRRASPGKTYANRSRTQSTSTGEGTCQPADLNKTFVITLDSLGSSHSRVQKKLRDYLYHEAKDKGKLADPKMSFSNVHQPEYVVAQVPNQPNYCDCGIYLLHYFDRFFSDPDYFLSMIVKSNSLRSREREEWQGGTVAGKREYWRARILELSDEWRAWKAERNAAAAAAKKEEPEAEAEAEAELPGTPPLAPQPEPEPEPEPGRKHKRRRTGEEKEEVIQVDDG